MKTLYYNGNIRTVEAANPTAEAFIVEGNRFSYVGSEAEARSLAEPGIREVNLGGRFVMPVFNDSHLHFIYTAKFMTRVKLGGSDSVDEIKRRLASRAEAFASEKGEWLIGEGWNQDYFIGDKRFPNMLDLDEVTGDIPTIVVRVCGHIAALNSAGLAKIGLDAESAKSHGDLVELLPSGEPSGIVKEKFLVELVGKLSHMAKDELKDLVLHAQKKLHERGITSVQSDDLSYTNNYDYDFLFETFRELENEGLLKMRLGEQASLETPEATERFFAKGYGYGWGSEKVRITAVKIFVDGSLGARTAALRQPYADDPSISGLVVIEPETLNELVRISDEHGCPVAAHGIGDKAIELILDAIEAVRRGGDKSIRHGVVHCQITDEAILQRIKDLEALTLIQPIFIDYDMNISEARVGAELTSTSYAWKSMVDLGIHASFGTDSPVEPTDPMRNLYCAVTRKNITGDVKRMFLPEQKLSMDEAIRGYTIESAYASGEEGIKGSILAGKLADFIVLDRDLFALTSDEDILDTRVLTTVFDGEVVYEGLTV